MSLSDSKSSDLSDEPTPLTYVRTRGLSFLACQHAQPFVTYSPSTKTVPLQSPTEGPTLFEDVERTAGGRAFLDVRVHVNREVTVEEKHAGETPEPRTSEKD